MPLKHLPTEAAQEKRACRGAKARDPNETTRVRRPSTRTSSALRTRAHRGWSRLATSARPG
ncbi:Hypothetical protein A7982_11481 [Minicystis rosea]|nr:Hypothetical protein A7982_11481 [Minicystis rosea]